jgi:two-component system, sensor histidine kinase and response regulator
MLQQAQAKWSYVLDEPTRILVVDDDPILREFASVYLSTPVATVETASDGSTALDLMLKTPFDVVLVDIEMPGMDGFELVRRARTYDSLRHLPLVMLTGREDIESIDRAYNLGATSFVTKPVNWRELSYQLRYVIRVSKMEGEARARAAENAALRAELVRHMRNELSDAVNAIIAYADCIAKGEAPDSERTAHAESIAALGQELLREFTYISGPAELTGSSMDSRPRNAA